MSNNTIQQSIQIGSSIPSLTLPPVSRTTLALYAGASGDHNPVHIDLDFAKQAGLDDVFVHGMLSMAYLARMLTDWQPQAKLRKFNSRFTAVTQVHDVIACTGKVIDLVQQDNETLAHCEIQATNANGETTLIGEAWVAI